jgi:hypothetical protein
MYNGMHGHLATIPTPAVNTFLTQHFSRAVNDGYWLGGFQPHGLLDPAAGWQWVTGAPFHFTNWSTIGGNQPDDYYGPGTSNQDEDRLHFWWQAGGTWDDLSHFDNSPLGYVVEYEPDPSADAPTITGYAAQPSGTPITSAPPGTSLLINGTNLGASGTVLFDSIPFPAAAATWTSTQILIWVPTALAYPFQAAVTVTVDRQQAHGAPFMITAPTPGQDNLLANASFEYPSSAGSPYFYGYTYGQPLEPDYPGYRSYAIPGWRIPIGTIDVYRTGWQQAPGQGQQSIDLVGSPYAATIAQTFFTVVGQDYLFSGWAAHNPDLSEARADVYLNDEFFLQIRDKGFTTSGAMNWTPFSFRFRATAAQTTLAIEDVTGINYFEGLALDGLSVTLAPGR